MTEPSKLTERLRGLLKMPAPPEASAVDAPVAGGTQAALELALGGRWSPEGTRSCFVVERRYEAAWRYGRSTVGRIAADLEEASGEAPLLAGGALARPPFVFFDLETTGLSGGAGTYAFLVGFGTFDAQGGFVTRQLVLARHADERQLLQAATTELARAGALVSFNGKSFDAPFIETRYLFHRLEWSGRLLPHVDVLHPARRFWKGEGASPCSLVALEAQVLDARRMGDVPGAEIPARYFQFVRSGDAGPLAAVLEHNRLDLLSLAGLTARLFLLARIGPGAVRHAREALALGHLYSRGGLESRATEAYQHAKAMASAASIKVEALRALAVQARRARRYGDAAACWLELVEMPGCPGQIAQEAIDALAIHHEHRARDLYAARAFALRSLGQGGQTHTPGLAQAAQHRLARIERKMEASEQRATGPSSLWPLACGSPTSARRTSS